MDNTDRPPLVREIIELRERYNFLKTPSDDLWVSKNEINKTSQQLFNDTFQQIHKNFVVTFKRPFNGGSSNLQFIAAEAPLDSGIEIIARPPGTKLRSIFLLSNGQHTMTVVALLFASTWSTPPPSASSANATPPLTTPA